MADQEGIDRLVTLSRRQPLTGRIETIASAIKIDRTVTFLYLGESMLVSRRVVDPERCNGLFLEGWCLHREQWRKFSVRRMRAVEVGPAKHEILLPLPELAQAAWMGRESEW